MAGMESWAAFSARALEIDIGTGLLDELKNAGISSFGKMAFICAANPNSGDDTPLVEAVEALIGRRPDANDMLPLRRLWYESHAIAISDMKSRLERTAGDAPRQMPLAERMQRLKRQKETLTGLQIDQTLEPAHAVVDKVQSMLEENCLHYLYHLTNVYPVNRRHLRRNPSLLSLLTPVGTSRLVGKPKNCLATLVASSSLGEP